MLLRQSSVDVENLIRLDLQRAVWELPEVAAINGSGTVPNPTGILNTVGIGSVIGGTNGPFQTGRILLIWRLRLAGPMRLMANWDI